MAYLTSIEFECRGRGATPEARQADRESTLDALRPTDCCFLCGGPLSENLIYWHGNDGRGVQIWLHRECALRLATHLLMDYHDGEEPIRGRDRAVDPSA